MLLAPIPHTILRRRFPAGGESDRRTRRSAYSPSPHPSPDRCRGLRLARPTWRHVRPPLEAWNTWCPWSRQGNGRQKPRTSRSGGLLDEGPNDAAALGLLTDGGDVIQAFCLYVVLMTRVFLSFFIIFLSGAYNRYFS